LLLQRVYLWLRYDVTLHHVLYICICDMHTLSYFRPYLLAIFTFMHIFIQVCVLTYPLTIMPPCSLAENMITALSSPTQGIASEVTDKNASIDDNNGLVDETQALLSLSPLDRQNSRKRSFKRTNSSFSHPDILSAAAVSVYPVTSEDPEDFKNKEGEGESVVENNDKDNKTISTMFRNSLRLIFVVLTTVCAAYVPCFGLVRIVVSHTIIVSIL